MRYGLKLLLAMIARQDELQFPCVQPNSMATWTRIDLHSIYQFCQQLCFLAAWARTSDNRSLDLSCKSFSFWKTFGAGGIPQNFAELLVVEPNPMAFAAETNTA